MIYDTSLDSHFIFINQFMQWKCRTKPQCTYHFKISYFSVIIYEDYDRFCLETREKKVLLIITASLTKAISAYKFLIGTFEFQIPTETG